MTNRMLIDAGHPEETRVVILRGNQVEDFDFESENKLPLRGNIYLAQVTRVEPSLQAAFVEYGGNRQGFLAFSEIHPDYYQIPVSDREELLRAHAEEDRQTASQEDSDGDGFANGDGSANGGATSVENIGGDAHEEALASGRTRNLTRKYKIQEVIKRRQVILIQVVKEERGNKGAALTTYLSLAGRYCVLMPNTARGGGISRKINNGPDRRKLKTIVEKLDVSNGMGLIIRTAGAQRTGTEIKRDYQYLIRMWEKIRELTMQSSAPAMVYEEGSIVKRSIRDLYNKDFDEIIVQGDEGYKDAKEYMKMLMPSHAAKVKPFKGDTPLYLAMGIEAQLAAMFNPVATLPSGGYLVINQTEALVAIDVNSGKSTKEHSIEKTALKTNLEAAHEVARQARLRDLAGLLVIDFIDMSENRNNRSVEHRLKDALKDDRARIQVGKISPFGLMEMSRQRMRSGILEGSSINCEHCAGTGMVRSVESRALHVLRLVEEEAAKRGQSQQITVNVPLEVASYILNQKRANLAELEERFGVSVLINGDASLNAMQMTLDKANEAGQSVIVRMDGDPESATAEDDGRNKKRRRRRGGRRNKDDEQRPDAEHSSHSGAGHPDAGKSEQSSTQADAQSGSEPKQNNEQNNEQHKTADGEESNPRRRRRGRRGGQGRRRDGDASNTPNNNDARTHADSDANVAQANVAQESGKSQSAQTSPKDEPKDNADNINAKTEDGKVSDEKPKTRRPRRKKADTTPMQETAEASETSAVSAAKPKKPAKAQAKKVSKAKSKTVSAEKADGKTDDKAEEKPKKKRASPKSSGKTSPKTSPKTSRSPKAEKAEKPPLFDKKAGAEKKAETEESSSDKPKRTGWWSGK